MICNRPDTLRIAPLLRIYALSLLFALSFVFTSNLRAETIATDVSPSQSTLHSTDPDGASGGRINHLAVTPADNTIYYAASEWGGLYKSVDRGRNWSRLDGHLPTVTWDVKVSPVDPHRVIATSFYDGRVSSIAGIHVSVDGGSTWTHPASAVPPLNFCESAARRNEPSAFGISFDPDHPQDVYVGTNCGLAVSHDSGGTWSFVDPTPADAATDVWSVVVHHGGIIDTCGDDGHRRSIDGAATWTTAGPGGTPLPAGTCSITASPQEPYILFAVVGTSVFESDDAGGTWDTQFANPAPQGRIPFVRTNNRSGPNFDLWFGDVSLFRANCATPSPAAIGGTPRCPGSTTWAGPFTRNAGAHDDMGDIVFDPQPGTLEACPVLMSSDGGVFFNTKAVSPDCQTPAWDQPTITPHGLWLFGMAGAHGSSGTGESVYFGTQDNGTFANTNAGAGPPVWFNRDCCDSFDASATSSQVLTTVCCFGGRANRMFIRGEGMTGGGEINTYPPGNLPAFETPDIIDRFDANAYAVVTSDGVFITSDITATPIVWTQLGSATSPVNACAVHATQTSPASFYVEAGTCSGSTSHRIFRYDGTAPNAAWQQLVPPLGHSGFGIFAVDGQNPSRLFASVLGGTGPAMMLSVDGGANWSSMPSLDSLMTGAGQFKYSNALGPTDFTGFGGYSQPSLVAFSSLDTQTLVAAGVDSGVFISHDGGATWTTITDNSGSPSNPLIPRAKFASFDRTGAGINIFIGTQGRGVWRVAEQPSMLYRVKFVCGQPVGDALAPGRYFTVINVHNPIEDASTKPINFRMKFAVSPPQQGHTGFGSSFDVGSDDVQKITCGDIIRAANGIANLCSASFCEGFVVLESQAELDVTAVYTAADLTPAQQVTTLHTARVLPHCPIRTEVLPEQTVLFVPPKQGGGDADYDGNGPCVDFRLALQLEDGDKTLAAKYRMHAFECAGDFSKPKADFTSAKGEEKIVLKIASPRGRILGYDVDNSVMQQYIDTNHSDDVFSFNPPSPVKTLRFVGDTIGDEAGTRTGVFITFQQITVELETCAPLTLSDVTIVPPKVPAGGRAVAIAVSQSDAKRLVVATESGGLFRTFDGGVSFQHLDAFPTLFAVDVVMASLDPNIVIATARDDFATTSGGGIWRSQDGGASWNRPAGWPPAGCSGRPAAAGISHMPLSRTFYVATDCGLAVSNDNGASFVTTPIDPANPKLFSVLVVNRTTGVAADSRRVWFLNNGQWTPSLGGPDAGDVFGSHAFASPWWAADNVFYHAGRDRKLWVSTTGGGAWRLMPTNCDIPPKECGNREPFVRVGRGLDGDPTHLDVYYGDGVDLWRQAVTTVVPGGNVGDWRQLKSDHSDPADLAFTPGNTEPLMLATDGGVHLTKDQGKQWTLTGSNVGGFVALQVGEMTGRQVGGSSPHLDLYYGTQDNQIKGSSDGGATWNGSQGGEGAFLQVDSANPAMVDGRVTGRSCGACRLFDVPPHLGQDDPGLFRNAPSGSTNNPDAHAPFQLIGDNFLQPLKLPPNSEYWLTGNRGANWAQAFTTPGTHVGRILFSGDLANPVAYVALEKGSGAKLIRASAVSGTPVVTAADQIGMGTIGLLRTGQARYAVVGVDPKEPNHLLAHDIFSGTKASRDGGVNWFALPALDAAVTDTGKFTAAMNAAPFVTTIAWDPTNSCHILVGTMQNGVIRSADGGLTWAQVPGSKNATIVTSFFFPPTGPIWMSTYGRGLWQVMSSRTPPASGRCEFPQPPGPVTQPNSPVVIMRTGGTPRTFTGLQDEAVCPTCTVLLVHDGWITDIDGDDSVRTVSTSGGYVEQRGQNGREASATVENNVREVESDGLRRRVGGGAADQRRVRGLILDGKRLVAYIAGSAPPAIAPLRKPAVFVKTMPDDNVQILGFQFLPGTGERGVTLTIEGETVATNAPVTADEKFEVRVRVRRPPGWVLVSAVQRDGLRTTIATTNLQVVDDK